MVKADEGLQQIEIIMNQAQTPTNGEAPTMETSSRGRNNGAKTNPEQEMILRLKTAIDDRGRYSYRLNDIAAGYAAGKGVSTTQARVHIEESFERQVGQSPQEYLDAHYAQLRQARPREGRSR